MSSHPLIPLSEPELSGREWTYVKQCLDTGWVSSAGPFVQRFEEQMAELIGVRYAVATSSCTAALHMALKVAGVEPEDEVLVPSLTFVASANAVRHANAWPVFIDAEPNYWQLDARLAEEFLRRRCRSKGGALVNKGSGRRVRAIMPVHVLGHPVDCDAVCEVARRYGLPIVEDAAESIGARYKDRMVGSHGDIACFSFNGNKTITTGGGGMIVTDNEQWAARARYLTTQAKDDPLEYVHAEVGYNYRLSNVLAAIGCAQLEGLEQAVQAKRRIAEHYRQSLGSIEGICVFEEAPEAYCGYWMSAVLVDAPRFGMSSRELCSYLETHGIQTRPLWQPMHAIGAYQECESIITGVADRLAEGGLCLPCSAGMSDQDLHRVTQAIHQAYQQRRAPTAVRPQHVA